jgi:hypothetical protein
MIVGGQGGLLLEERKYGLMMMIQIISNKLYVN